MTDRIALVTGASRGLGALIASGLASEGTTVVGVARSPVNDWVIDDDRVDRRVCDVTDESAVKRLFSDLRKQHGRLDVLINNAGAFSGDLLVSASSSRFLSLLNANLVSVHVVSREAAKMMRTHSWGRVVTISSIATSIPLVGNALYASGKAGVESLMRDFALEFRGSGLTFNSVAVSFVEHTAMVDALKPEARASYEARLLVPRPLQVSELLAAITFLLSPEAGAVTGQVIALGSPF